MYLARAHSYVENQNVSASGNDNLFLNMSTCRSFCPSYVNNSDDNESMFEFHCQ